MKPEATVRRLLLRPLVPLYRLVLNVREMWFNAGLAPVRRLTYPVISIGNLSTGGSGKTPLTIALAKALIARGLRPDVLSRGYGREAVEPAHVLLTEPLNGSATSRSWLPGKPESVFTSRPSGSTPGFWPKRTRKRIVPRSRPSRKAQSPDPANPPVLHPLRPARNNPFPPKIQPQRKQKRKSPLSPPSTPSICLTTAFSTANSFAMRTFC